MSATIGAYALQNSLACTPTYVWGQGVPRVMVRVWIKKRIRKDYAGSESTTMHELLVREQLLGPLVREGSNCLGENTDAEPSPGKVRATSGINLLPSVIFG